jgi:hypothetical protein
MSHQPLLPTDETSSKSDTVVVDKQVRRPSILHKLIDAPTHRKTFTKRSLNVSFKIDISDVDEVVAFIFPAGLPE